MDKTIWIDASKARDADSRKKLILTALESGFGHIVVSPSDKKSKKFGRFHMIILAGDRFTYNDKEIGRSIKITSKKDEKRASDLAGKSDIVIIEATDWKVIPLENLIVKFAKSKSKLFVRADNVDDAKLFLETMEKGADGIVVAPSSPQDISKLSAIVAKIIPDIRLMAGTVTRIKQVSLGDRVCIDTCSMLNQGEGMLIGNSSSGMFLVHAETLESEYVASRPFRINAGAVHAYTLMPDGNTKYLSELNAGDEVLIVDSKGKTKSAVVGRSKIERRPLLLIEAEVAGRTYSTIVQNAETIRLISGKKPISVTDLKPGDKICMRIEAGGRHFGNSVKETIKEK
ncbi:MAG: 3-dehydroquinate synthase II [Thermoplasmata archaeon]|nr:3-dehydroquinate synthase II [Thermoplasmata archaeon]